MSPAPSKVPEKRLRVKKLLKRLLVALILHNQPQMLQLMRRGDKPHFYLGLLGLFPLLSVGVARELIFEAFEESSNWNLGLEVAHRLEEAKDVILGLPVIAIFRAISIQKLEHLRLDIRLHSVVEKVFILKTRKGVLLHHFALVLDYVLLNEHPE